MWTRRLACYRRLHALWKAEAETGAFRAANDRYARERTAIEARFGTWEAALASPKERPRLRAAYRRVCVAENVFYDAFTAPLHRALARLVQTTVPNLPALLTKIEIIREHEPDLFEDAPLDAFERLLEDVRRLGKE